MKKVVVKFKKRTSNGENAVHFVFQNNKGFYVHICRILTDNNEWYINTRVIRKFHEKYYVETCEMYTKETWELIVQAIDFAEVQQ